MKATRNLLKEEQKKDAKKKQEQERQESAAGQPEQEIATEEPGTELSKAPEVSFIDYSQDIQNEAGDVLLLSVTENCPVISYAFLQFSLLLLYLLKYQINTTASPLSRQSSRRRSRYWDARLPAIYNSLPQCLKYALSKRQGACGALQSRHADRVCGGDDRDRGAL